MLVEDINMTQYFLQFVGGPLLFVALLEFFYLSKSSSDNRKATATFIKSIVTFIRRLSSIHKNLTHGRTETEREIYKKALTLRMRLHVALTVDPSEIDYYFFFELDNLNLIPLPERYGCTFESDYGIEVVHYTSWLRDILSTPNEEINSAEYISQARIHLRNIKRSGFRPNRKQLAAHRYVEKIFNINYYQHSPSPLGWKSNREEGIDSARIISHNHMIKKYKSHEMDNIK